MKSGKLNFLETLWATPDPYLTFIYYVKNEDTVSFYGSNNSAASNCYEIIYTIYIYIVYIMCVCVCVCVCVSFVFVLLIELH